MHLQVQVSSGQHGGCMHQAAVLQYLTAWCLVPGRVLPDDKWLKSPETCHLCVHVSPHVPVWF